MANPLVTKITFNCQGNGDNLDSDSKVNARIYLLTTPNWILYADGSHVGPNLSDISLQFDLSEFTKPLHKADLNGKCTFIQIAPTGNDKWNCWVKVYFFFDDGTKEVFEHGQANLGNHDGWGDFSVREIQGIN